MKISNKAIGMKNILVILTLMGLVSCNNDLEINAPYKQIPVIYGFININDSFQYLRIQKVFQNSIQVKASEASKISDSLELKDIKVQLIVVRSFTNDTINCYRTNEFNKESGFFANDKNFIYKSQYYNLKAFGDILSVNLLIKDTVLGKVYTSQSDIIGDQAIEERNITISEDDTKSFSFLFTANPSAYIVDAAVRLKYNEASAANPTAFEEKYYDYYVLSSAIVSDLIRNNPKISRRLQAKAVFEDWKRFFASQSVNVVRQYVGIEYLTWGAGSQFLDLQEISKPNISFVQKRTDYSNISGGALGLFAARTINKQKGITVDAAGITLIKTLPKFQP
jgi:hypothetical protein